jgi:flagellar motor switch protein FliM
MTEEPRKIKRPIDESGDPVKKKVKKIRPPEFSTSPAGASRPSPLPAAVREQKETKRDEELDSPDRIIKKKKKLIRKDEIGLDIDDELPPVILKKKKVKPVDPDSSRMETAAGDFDVTVEEQAADDFSQDDIDSLINKYVPAAAETEPAYAKIQDCAEETFQFSPGGKRFRKYDFRHPDKLSKEQVRKIKARFEPLPRYLSNYFTKILKKQVEVRLLEIDQKRYGDIFRPGPTPVIYGVFLIGPTFPTGIIDLPIHLFYSILERMMGGTGLGRIPIHPLTDFENYLITDIYSTILQYYREIFSKVVSIEPQIELVSTDGLIIPKTLSPEEVMVRKVYEIKIGDISGYLTISLPYNFIGNYFTKYGAQKAETISESESAASVLRAKTYKKMMVPMSVEFSKMRVRTADLLNLAPGQVIYLNHNLETDLGIKINGKLKFFGKAGMRGNKMAIKITSTIEEEVI